MSDVNTTETITDAVVIDEPKTETKETPAVPETVEKPAAKKPAARKPSAKKPTAKKSTAKKPAAKKNAAEALAKNDASGVRTGRSTAKKAAPRATRRSTAYAPEISEAVRLAKAARGTNNGAPGPKQHAAVRDAVSKEIDGAVTKDSLLAYLGLSEKALRDAASGKMPTEKLREIDAFRKVQRLDALQDPKIRVWVGGRNGASILVAWVTQLKAA